MISKRPAHRTLLAGVAPTLLSLGLSTVAAASPPSDATSHGMTELTYATPAFNTTTVDINDTKNRGYKWYILDLFGKQATSTNVRLNSDGSVSMLGNTGGAIGSLASAIPYRGTNAFVGTSFGGGGYFEAVFKYDASQVTSAHAGGKSAPYPAWWSLPMEGNILDGGNQWPGQPAGYVHNVEVDFFEADYVTKPISYGVGMHDWYGISKKTCSTGLCVVHFNNPTGERIAPSGTNYNTWHTYGVLWVPATATTQGIFSAYFDGKLVGHTRNWTQYTNQAPTPVGKTWCFGRVDQQHQFFILGTGTGQSFALKSVNVWQRDTSKNMTN